MKSWETIQNLQQKYKSTDEGNTYYISTGVVYTEPEKKEPEKDQKRY